MDQWQLEELAKVVERCKVKVVSARPAGRDAAALPRRAGRDGRAGGRRLPGGVRPEARVAVIPKGPYVLPYVA